MSFYNPPSPPIRNAGLPVLQSRLMNHSTRKTSTIMGMNANLHHPHWSPPRYKHVHPTARELIKMFGQASFRVMSKKHTPTFFPHSRGGPMTIDLTWVSYAATKLSITMGTTSNNLRSDHQA
ncbi:hypothetical protein CROQUDRAFT_688266, partial [Cronartium quercuum f. sp. fusiforme G11]